MSFIKKFPEKASEFVVTRYPLWMAFVLLMMISDQAQEAEDQAALPARLLYANIGMTLFCGFTLSMTHLSSKMSMVFAGQLGYQAYNLVFNSAFRLHPFLALRMASRNLGLMAVFTLYAYHADSKQKKKRSNANNNNGSNNANIGSNSGSSGNVGFHLLGHFLLAAFFGSFAYLLKYERGEREAFMLHVVGSTADDAAVEGDGGAGGDAAASEDKVAVAAANDSHFLLETCFWLCVILAGVFLSRKLVRYSFKTALIFLALYTFYIDCDVGYWATVTSPAAVTATTTTATTSTSPATVGVTLWMQIRLISDNVAILAALLLFDISATKIKTD